VAVLAIATGQNQATEKLQRQRRLSRNPPLAPVSSAASFSLFRGAKPPLL